MKITSLGKPDGRARDVQIHVDGELVLTVADEVAFRHGCRVGEDIDTVWLEAIRSSDLAWRAKESALRCLASGRRTRSQLRQRLLRKEFPARVVDECLDQLERSKLIDDGEFARSFVRDRMRFRPRGKAAILAELKAKGIPRDEAAAAIAEGFSQGSTDELDLARRAAAKFRHRPREEALPARRRLYAFLARKGFAPDTISLVLENYDPGVRDEP
jgi:regulatory protein